jgi:hypothetical protein
MTIEQALKAKKYGTVVLHESSTGYTITGIINGITEDGKFAYLTGAIGKAPISALRTIVTPYGGSKEL